MITPESREASPLGESIVRYLCVDRWDEMQARVTRLANALYRFDVDPAPI
jgi:hypothetical protein